MDRLAKALGKLSLKERKVIESMLRRLIVGDIQQMDIKKLKNRDDIYRVRKGDIRIIYRRDAQGKIFLLTIERRSDTTYSP